MITGLGGGGVKIYFPGGIFYWESGLLGQEISARPTRTLDGWGGAYIYLSILL